MIQTKTITANSPKQLDDSINIFLKNINPQMIRDIKLVTEFDGTSYTRYTAMVIYNHD